MLAVARREHNTPTLVERPQPNPVFRVERLLTHWHENLLLPLPRVGQRATVRVLAWWRRVRPEPGALLGYDGAVTLEVDKHERFKLHEARSIRGVPRRGHFVVDSREEVIRFEVFWQLRRVAIILRLHKVLLRPFVGHAGAPRCARAGRARRVACMGVCLRCPCVASRR